MKKWLYILLFLAGVVIIVYLDQKAIIRWQYVAIIVAALAAPIRLMANILNDQENEIRNRQRLLR